MTEIDLTPIENKLDIIIKLLAKETLKGREVREQVSLLHAIGINNKEIAAILGKSQNTINVTLSQARRRNDND